MSKLSKDSLGKRFACQYCGEPLRTRQGLSGHTQWKHADGKIQPPVEFDDINAMAKGWEKWGKYMLLSAAQIRAQENILKKWLEVRAFCKYLNIKLNNTDFKNYVLSSLAQLNSNEELRKELS